MNVFLSAFLVAFAVYAIRYLVFAGLAYFISQNKAAFFNRISRPHIVPPAGFSFAPHIKRELLNSLISLIVYASVIMIMIGFGLLKYSQLYFDISQYPTWWFWLSIIVTMFLFDTLFYWCHRLLHTKYFYPIHKLHHLSVYPTSFAANSFQMGEAFIEAILMVTIIFIIPIHFKAFLIYQTVSIAYNVYGHSSREFMPMMIMNNKFGKYLNTASLHAHHHYTEQSNYSFYFTFWDRLMGTLSHTSKSDSNE